MTADFLKGPTHAHVGGELNGVLREIGQTDRGTAFHASPSGGKLAAEQPQ